MRFCSITIGCKANQFDTQTIESVLLQNGHESVEIGTGADVVIVNTCAVTAESVAKSRRAIRRVKRLEPNAYVAVCGCFSKLESDAVEKIGVDIIGGADKREEFAARIEEYALSNRKGDKMMKCSGDSDPASHRRTRALLKIQDGCDNTCAYCIIPAARGASHSIPIKELSDGAKKLHEQGNLEIVITGIEISSYGKDIDMKQQAHEKLPQQKKTGSRAKQNEKKKSPVQTSTKISLITAVSAISINAPHSRLRLGSLDPAILTDKFIDELAQINNLCNHFHISLQSGSDETLKAMGRKYTTKDVLCAINKLRNTFDDCAVTADLIVGFPGETNGDFDETMHFIKKAGFSDMHIFKYSKRPGTIASTMTDQVDEHIKKKRARIAAEVAAKMKQDFKAAQIGKTVDVLFEQTKNKVSFGHTSNYIEVAVEGEIPRNTMQKVMLTELKSNMLFGIIAICDKARTLSQIIRGHA